MPVSAEKTGEFIAWLRKERGLTQAELGERLGVSFQAVSKWERGETLPDTAVLPDLAAVLETSVDELLSGGDSAASYRGRITVSDMRDGLESLKRMGELLGKDNLIYRHAIRGINEGMNTDIEPAFADDYTFECFLAEAIIQNLMAGAYIDLTDVKKGFKHDRFRDIVCKYAEKYGII